MLSRVELAGCLIQGKEIQERGMRNDHVEKENIIKYGNKLK